MPTQYTPMRKALVASFGDASHISIVNSEIAAPSSNEVQVKILYAGMGGSDISMRAGVYPNQKKAPLTPGYSFIGRVHVSGKNSSKYRQGDLVSALTMYDSDAEYINVEEKYLIPVPNGLNLEQAVALVLDWTTAYGMAFRSAKITKGDRVFIHGLSGAVGHALFKLCQLQGAEIYGTASESNHDELIAEGANPFVYNNKDWILTMNSMGGAHHVFDPLGFESWDESWSILAREGGHLIGYGGNMNILVPGAKQRSQAPAIAKLLSRNLVPFCPQKTTFYYVDKDQKTFVPELEKLYQMLGSGEIQVRVKKVWTLEQIPEAHEKWTQTKGYGSVVVKIADDY